MTDTLYYRSVEYKSVAVLLSFPHSEAVASSPLSQCPFFFFCRFSPQLTQEVMLDEVSDAVLVDMMWETQMYLYEKRESLQSLAKLLLDI